MIVFYHLRAILLEREFRVEMRFGCSELAALTSSLDSLRSLGTTPLVGSLETHRACAPLRAFQSVVRAQLVQREQQKQSKLA